jgi:hypothetical protein
MKGISMTNNLKILFFGSKTTLYLSLALHKAHPYQSLGSGFSSRFNEVSESGLDPDLIWIKS